MKSILMLIAFGAVSVKAISSDVEKLEDLLTAALDLDPDTGLSINEFIDKYGYTFESHEVTTEDGYILTLHRIPHRKPDSIKGPGDANVTRPVALLVHGLLCSSGAWLFQGPNASLAFQLVDQGYDVWLSNARGNSYSNKHVTLTRKDAAFWDYSFHEIGFYDLPANIDYILNATKVDKITYIGHSQGSTTGAVLLSSRPEYNKKLNLMAMLSPVIYVTQVRSPIARFLQINDVLIKQVLKALGIYAIEHSQVLELVLNTLCNEKSPVQGQCIDLLGLFAGFDKEQFDKSKLTVFFTYTPSGAPYKIVDHYIQEVTTGIFRQFDYVDPIKNFEHYGSLIPPSYDIAQISAPMAVYYSKNDFFVGVQDGKRFISELKGEIADQYLVEYEKFSHLDFITAKDAKTLLYDRVVEVVKKYNPLP